MVKKNNNLEREKVVIYYITRNMGRGLLTRVSSLDFESKTAL